MQMHGYEHVANASELGGTNTSAVTEADKGTEDPVSTGATETISITLPPRGEKEYKLYLTKGAVLTYSWKTDG